MKNLFIAFGILTLLISCKQKTPCEEVTCKQRQICDNGICKCDSDSYNLGNWCFPKVLGSNLVFYNISTDCQCFDTTILIISSEPRIGIGTSSNPEPLEISLTAIFPQNESGGQKSVSADYFRKPDGDSLYATNDYLWGIKCAIKNTSHIVSPIVMGKFNKTKDSLVFKIKWYESKIGQATEPVLIDSCTKIYTRKVL